MSLKDNLKVYTCSYDTTDCAVQKNSYFNFTAGIFTVGITYCFEHKIFTTHKWIHYTLHTMKYHYYAGPLTCTAQISRVWTPPTSSAHSSHSPLWNQILGTAVEHFCTLNCVGIVLQRSTLWGNWCTTVNWRNDQALHGCWNRYTTHMYLALLCSQLVFVPEFKECRLYPPDHFPMLYTESNICTRWDPGTRPVHIKLK